MPPWLVWVSFLIWARLSYTSASFLTSIQSQRQNRQAADVISTILATTYSSSSASDLPNTTNSFTLPVFPLRKTVRLPSESLVLNLYEERYLALAESVLAQQQQQSTTPPCIFGAIYSSNKPQMIKGGSGPIVPMFEKGDVGVVFAVTNSQENMIPTTGGQELRRRIRLEARGTVRFQVQDIVQAGYDDGSCPYIVVQGSLYEDSDSDWEDTSESDDTLQEDGLGNGKEDILQCLQLLLGSSDSEVVERRLKELSSFASLSAKISDIQVKQRLAALHLQSSAKRRAYYDQTKNEQ